MAIAGRSRVAAADQISASDYQQLVLRVRERVRKLVPPGTTAAVVSKGDDDLLRFSGRDGWHFMRMPDGKYAGYHPADSDAAIARLEKLRQEGADYLVVPSTSFWWLDYYEGFGRHVDESYRLLFEDDDCLIFHLIEGQVGFADTDLMAAGDRHDPAWERAMIEQLVQALLPTGSVPAVLTAGESGGVPGGCQPWRLPADALASERAALRALEELAAGEARFLVIPSSAASWIGQDSALADSLRREHRLVTIQRHVCEIYELARPGRMGRDRAGIRRPVNGASANGSARTPTTAHPHRGLFARLRSALGRGGG